MTFQQSAGLRPGRPGVSLAARCLAGILGKSEHVDTIHLFVGSDSPLCPLSLCPEPLLVLGSSERVRKWQAGRVEAWALCLLGFWEGSQWFAKNSPKSWLWPPGGQRCLSHSKAFGDRLCIFPVASMAWAWAWDLGASCRLLTAAGLATLSSQAFVWDLVKKK